MLREPPPLDKLRSAEKSQKKYMHVPQTPPPRKHRLDTNLTIPQTKLEHAMHALVHNQETNEREAVATAAALVRSAWEDLQQQRRHILAGKQAFKLDKRTDDTRPRLLSKEEEQKINRGRKPFVPRARTFWGDTPAQSSTQGSQPPRAPSKPRGKGKGKGKGL